jgi:hypothetical protein
MVSLGICTVGNNQNFLGAKFNTKTASFTAIIDNVYDAVFNQDAVSI